MEYSSKDIEHTETNMDLINQHQDLSTNQYPVYRGATRYVAEISK